jgi:hypothetical protein
MTSASVTHNRVVACDYAAHGIPVFLADATPHPKDPDRPNKRPLSRFKETATTDLSAIRQQFDANPDALVGIPCGHANIVVIDCDVRDGKQGVKNFEALEHKYGRIQGAVRVKTVSGGLHIIVQKPAGAAIGNSPGGLPPDIDVRGDGGYIIAPGTTWAQTGAGWTIEDGSERLFDAIASGTLAEAPGWLLDILSGKIDERPLSQRAIATQPRQAISYNDDPDAEGRYLEAALRCIPADDRDIWLKIGGALHDSGQSWGRSLWDSWSQSSGKYDASDQQTTWASYSRHTGAKAGVGTIIALARDYGFDGRKYERRQSQSKSRQAVNQDNEYDLPEPDWLSGMDSSYEPDATPHFKVEPPKPTPAQKVAITPSPYVHRDPVAIPPRPWLYGKHYIRGFTSATVAPGGSGKSGLAIAECLAMATGNPFLGASPVHRLKTWYFGGEDPREETERRIAAHIKHHGLDPETVSQNLFFDSGRDLPIKIAHIEGKAGFSIASPVSEALIDAIKTNGIDVVVIDPFVSCHSVSENDNVMIDGVVKEFGRIAGIANCAIELIHHTRKNSGSEVTGEDARGAKSMSDATRSLRVINTMSAAECGLAQVPESQRRGYFRVGDEKTNMKPAGQATWYHLKSVQLGNATELYPDGDDVAAVETFTFPDLLDGITVNDLRTAQDIVSKGNYRASQQAKEWAGHAIGEKLGIKTSEKGGKERMNKILSLWISNGMFEVVEEKDAKSTPRPMLRVGKLVDSND